MSCWAPPIVATPSQLLLLSEKGLLGAGAHGDGAFTPAVHAVAHTIPETLQEPALGLFAESQARQLVFVSAHPLLTRPECDAVCAEVEAHVNADRGGVWPTVRRSSVPTTDCAVEDVPTLRPWLRALLATRLFPMLAGCFPLLAGGRPLLPDDLRVHDAFIVRYDARAGGPGSTSLPEHSDTSALSISLALNEGGGVDYSGGGTLVAALRDTPCGGVVEARTGHAVAFAGPLRHGGEAVTSGVRMVLVLFLYVEGWAYGKLLRHRPPAADGDSAAASRGYVVYRETSALMEALEV